MVPAIISQCLKPRGATPKRFISVIGSNFPIWALKIGGIFSESVRFDKSAC